MKRMEERESRWGDWSSLTAERDCAVCVQVFLCRLDGKEKGDIANSASHSLLQAYNIEIIVFEDGQITWTALGFYYNDLRVPGEGTVE